MTFKDSMTPPFDRFPQVESYYIENHTAMLGNNFNQTPSWGIAYSSIHYVLYRAVEPRTLGEHICRTGEHRTHRQLLFMFHIHLGDIQ